MRQTLGQPPVDTPLDVTNDQVDVSANIHWTNWLSLIFNILLNVGPTLRKVAIVTFPACPAQSSVDVEVPFPGVQPGAPFNPISIISLIQIAGIATAITATPHRLSTGSTVFIFGASLSGYNGRFTATVIDATSFTFPVSALLVSPAVGTLGMVDSLLGATDLVVTLGLPGYTKYTVNNGFLAFVSAVDVVTIREFCVDPFGIGPFTDTFTILVSFGEPSVK